MNLKTFSLYIVLLCFSFLLVALPISQAAAEPYLGNRNSQKFHLLSCYSGKKIAPANQIYFDTRSQAIEASYIPCKICKP